MVNVTLCFSANQALLAAKAGATFVSPFVGRHDDVGYPGMELIADIRLIYDNYDFRTEILVASVRNPIHVHDAAKIGADVMTAPPAVIRQLFKHPLTDNGIKAFLADWEKTGQKHRTDVRDSVRIRLRGPPGRAGRRGPTGPDHQANGGCSNSPSRSAAHVARARVSPQKRVSSPRRAAGSRAGRAGGSSTSRSARRRYGRAGRCP